MNRKTILWIGFILLLFLIVCCLVFKAKKIQRQRQPAKSGLQVEKVTPTTKTPVQGAVKPPTQKTEKLSAFLATHQISFRPNASQIDEKARKILDVVADTLRMKGPLHLLVVGHADASGSSGLNQTLSVQRAQAVADYLKQKGLANVTFEIIGKGSSEPVGENATREGRRQNRRVELIVKGE